MALVSFAIAGTVSGCKRSKAPETTPVLHLPALSRVKTFDPAFVEDPAEFEQVGLAYETLYQLHPAKESAPPIPAIAESAPECSADRLVCKIRLKSGILFQDDPAFRKLGGRGREITADDIVFSLKRVMDPEGRSPSRWGWVGRTVRAKPLTVLDRYTVQLNLTRPWPELSRFLAHPNHSIIPSEAVEFYGKEFGQRPVGSGPYRLEEFLPESKIRWRKNPTFRREAFPSELEGPDLGKALPLMDRVEFLFFADVGGAWQQFLTGGLDLSPVPPSEFASAARPVGVRYFRTEESHFHIHALNMANPLWENNRPLRQAVISAAPALGSVPNPCRLNQASLSAFDPSSLPELEYLVLDDPVSISIAEAASAAWKEAGIRTTIRRLGPSAMETARHEGKAHLWIEYGDPVGDCSWLAAERRSALWAAQPWLRNFRPHEFDAGSPKYYKVDQKHHD